MACNNYLPKFQDQINADDPMGGSNCTCYSGAMAGDYDTCGTKVPTGKKVRALTGDKIGGTNLVQVDNALKAGYGIDLDTRIGSSRLTWEQFVREIDKGKGAILQGSYVALYNTKFTGDRNFKGNHAIFVPPGWGVMDPLCDGRRPGVYKYHGEAYPKDLLRQFAGLLELDAKTHKRLGIGYVWCSLTRDNQAKYNAKVPPKKFYRYIVKDGKIVSRVHNTTHTGFSDACSPPKTFAVAKGTPLYKTIKSKRIVQLLEGHRKGWYITASWAKEV